ncbi:MAG: hypothetical protein DLM50_00130 [Candidatus Meridianibacter frigidus]|nr:MAG: hypothetical protein DLM50_00130 [Candidatus Eremiobacteraeota bacterium]
MKSLTAPFVLLFAFLAACSGGGGQRASSSPTVGPSVANPISFPLVGGSKILAAKDYTQTVNSNSTSYNGVLMQGNGTYKGSEVIAAAPSSFAQLRTWLRSLDAKPPTAYQRLSNGNMDDARANAGRIGLDFSTFQTTRDGKPVGLLVVVMDPAVTARKLGPVLGLISRYRNLPDFAKAPIDNQVKQQTGFSVTEALQPQSPLGMALDSLGEFAHTNQRAILLLDARKE